MNRVVPLVKICGLTHAADVEAALHAGADAVGFVLVPGSPRGVGAKACRRLAERVSPPVLRVGVFQDADLDDLLKTADDCALDVIQLHGREPPAYVKRLAAFRTWKAVSLENDRDIDRVAAFPAEVLVVDTMRGGLRGGTGATGRWDLAMRLAARRRIALAGGLDAGNVARAVREVRPCWVDASSRLESAPGRKDTALLREFVRAVRAADYEAEIMP